MTRRTVVALLIASLAVSAYAGPQTTVYATKEGKHYHRKNCRLKHGSTGIKLSEALKKGLKPCKVCKPDSAKSG